MSYVGLPLEISETGSGRVRLKRDGTKVGVLKVGGNTNVFGLPHQRVNIVFAELNQGNHWYQGTIYFQYDDRPVLTIQVSAREFWVSGPGKICSRFFNFNR